MLLSTVNIPIAFSYFKPTTGKSNKKYILYSKQLVILMVWVYKELILNFGTIVNCSTIIHKNFSVKTFSAKSYINFKINVWYINNKINVYCIVQIYSIPYHIIYYMISQKNTIIKYYRTNKIKIWITVLTRN